MKMLRHFSKVPPANPKQARVEEAIDVEDSEDEERIESNLSVNKEDNTISAQVRTINATSTTTTTVNVNNNVVSATQSHRRRKIFSLEHRLKAWKSSFEWVDLDNNSKVSCTFANKQRRFVNVFYFSFLHV